MDKLARIVKTFTFKLALVYVGLFSLSVITLFAFIYTFAMRYLESQVSDAVRVQYSYIQNEYHVSGSSGVVARIKELIADDDEGAEIYLFVDRDYKKLAGNLNEWPEDAVVESSFDKTGNWIRFHIEGLRNAQTGVEVKAIVVPISKWRYLLVGQSLQSKGKIEKIIVQTFWASLFVTMIMAFGGAIIMTRSVMARINIINRSAGDIISGQFAARIPFAEGGDEFDELSSNLNQMLDRIEMLLQSLSLFANNIAHDLRSPLNRIINRLEAALRTIDDDNPARKILEKNIADMQELIGTFNSILKISELEANTEFREFTSCNLQKLIENLVEFYEPYAAEKDITLTNLIHLPLTLQGEKNLLTQAFANLLDNAIKFSPKGGTVTLSTERGADYAEIIIADGGAGIPEDFREKVFQKFFRLEQSRHTKGNGLGLSLVEAIARIHNATISLRDNNPGLQVRIRFNA